MDVLGRELGERAGPQIPTDDDLEPACGTIVGTDDGSALGAGAPRADEVDDVHAGTLPRWESALQTSVAEPWTDVWPDVDRETAGYRGLLSGFLESIESRDLQVDVVELGDGTVRTTDRPGWSSITWLVPDDERGSPSALE